VSLGLLVLRIATGAVFINHGYAKLFKMGFAGVTGAFTHMGVPLPGVMGPFVALLEFFGGIALVFGLLTRLFALGFAIDMCVAILLVKLGKGFSGLEFEFMLMAAGVALFLSGAGSFSVDEQIAHREGAGPS
jgi:putative oxidoreductase